jgi:EamA-like transporter family
MPPSHSKIRTTDSFDSRSDPQRSYVQPSAAADGASNTERRRGRMGWGRDRAGLQLPRRDRGGDHALSRRQHRSDYACDPALGDRLLLRAAGGAVVEGALAAAALATGLSAAPPGAWRGELIMTAAVLCMAFYNVWSRPFIQRSSALGFLTVGMGTGAAALILVGSLTGSVAALSQFSTPQWIAGIYLGVAGGALAFILWVLALERASPTRVANTMTVNPLAAGCSPRNSLESRSRPISCSVSLRCSPASGSQRRRSGSLECVMLRQPQWPRSRSGSPGRRASTPRPASRRAPPVVSPRQRSGFGLRGSGRGYPYR